MHSVFLLQVQGECYFQFEDKKRKGREGRTEEGRGKVGRRGEVEREWLDKLLQVFTGQLPRLQLGNL